MDAAAKQRVRGVRLRERALVRDNRETFEFWPERVDAREIDLRQPAARQLAGSDPGGKLPERGECDIGSSLGRGRHAGRVKRKGPCGAGMRKFGGRGSKRLAVGIEFSRRILRRASAEAICPSRFSSICRRSASV